MCVSVLPLGHCAVAEAECNRYLLDINIYDPYREKMLRNLPKGNMMIDRKGKAKLDISVDL
jgi:hypothetical protein